ncbi:energy-coupling factor transporter transmembrane component T [Corynebacterium tapiri]|uniref:ABC transporter permease n=1 Tax=Corynebacterium tapiri TaxID=1448266 RepID=A0A5C4U7L7_9CORY|nr:energy-coupling factor transporter transmembrane component T [Corynebacterium tapiri]TNL99691.1 ABC transporter permease [Corynebacterium tapiri]
MIHPWTALSLGLSGFVLVLLGQSEWINATIIALGMLAPALRRHWAPALAVTGLSLPTWLSMVVIYAPYGDVPLAPLLTADGLGQALHLGLRFSALVASVVGAMAWTSSTEMAKALQVTSGGARWAYVVGASFQVVGTARETASRVKGADRVQVSIEKDERSQVLRVPRQALMVMTHMLAESTQRAEALHQLGIDNPGPRTLLRPVPDSRLQRALRWLLPVVAVGIALAGRWVA